MKTWKHGHDKTLIWIEILWCEANFYKCRIFQCVFHLNHLANWNLTWTCNKFCCTVHHISHFHHRSIMEYLVELFFIHSYFSFEFSELNSIVSIEFLENYFQLFCKWKWLNIVFYKFYRFHRRLILVILKMKMTKNSLLQTLYILQIL